MDSNLINKILDNITNKKIEKTRTLVNLVRFTNIAFFVFAVLSTVFLKNGWILLFVWFDFLIVSLIFYEYSFIMPLFFFPVSFLFLYAFDYSIFEGEILFYPCVSGGILELLISVCDSIEFFGYGGTKHHFAVAYRRVWEPLLLDFTVLCFRFITAAPYIFTGIILFFPLISSVILLMFGKKIGGKLAGLFSSGMIGTAATSAFFFWAIYPIFAFKLATYLLRLFLREFNYHSKVIERIFTDPHTADFSWDEVVEVSLDQHLQWLKASKTFFKYNTENPDMLHLYNKIDPEVYLNFGDMVSFFSMNFTWSLKFDNLTLVMSFVILFISFAVHLFSCDYMKNDANQVRFFSFLSLFTFFMLLLVCAHDFVVFYIAWEGVGICSFLLISFWFTRVQAVKAAMKALLVNKIGDVCLLIAGAIIFKFCSSLDFGVVFFLFPVTGNELINGTTFTHIDLACLLLMLASLVKSAQLFFHVWLADAMEGPTPVSALLHAATMVTAGVFLIIRFSFIFEYSSSVLNLLMYISVLTIILIGIVGMFQYDIKKIIAYSTCSQLGIMFLACSLSGYTFALFHFFNHAFFKALLFMSAGNIIHALGNEQDIRKMGALKNVLPFSYMTFLISSLSLVGFPFFSGYYSKDAIILLAYSKLMVTSENPSPILFYLIIVSLALTCFYSFRLIYYVFLGNTTRISRYLHNNIKEELNFFNTAPLFILALLSIFSGYLFNFYFIGVGSNFFYEASILTFCEDVKFYLFHKEAKTLILFTLIFSYMICIIFCYAKDSLAGSGTAFKFYYNKVLRKIFYFFNKKAYFDDLYNLFLNSKIYKAGHSVYTLVDKGILEIFGPRGLGRFVFKVSKLIKRVYNSGPIAHLVYLMMLGVVILFVIAIILL